jgi:hypothetical protein
MDHTTMLTNMLKRPLAHRVHNKRVWISVE